MPLAAPHLLTRLWAAWSETRQLRHGRQTPRLARKDGPLAQFVGPNLTRGTARSFGALARDGFAGNVVLYRAATLLVASYIGIPWLLYDRASGGAKPKPATGPAAEATLRLLNVRANPQQSAQRFWGRVLLTRLLAGEVYLYLVPNPVGTHELYALRPDRVSPDPHSITDAGVGQWVYSVGSQRQLLPGAQVLHLCALSAEDDDIGVAPARVAGRAVDQHNAASDWNAALLQNMARPAGVLAVKGSLTPEQRDALKSDLQEHYTGPTNAGRPLVGEGDLTWQQISYSPAEMDWHNGKVTASREIAMALGIPPELLGDHANATFSNYGEARRSFYTETLLPMLDADGMELDAWLLPLCGLDADRYTLGYNRETIEALAEDRGRLWQQVTTADFLTVDEKRAALGYEPLGGPEGAALLVQRNRTTLEDLTAPPEPQPVALQPAVAPGVSGPDAGPDQGIQAAALEGIPPAAKVHTAGHKAAAPPAKKPPTGRAAAQRAVEQTVAEHLRSEAAEVVTRLRAAATPDDALRALQEVLASGSAAEQAWGELLSGSLAAVGQEAGNRLFTAWQRAGWLPADVAYSPDRAASLLTDALRVQPFRAAEQITWTTRDRLTRRLERALDTSEMDAAIASLQEQYDTWAAGGRAEGIAEVQTVGAWGLGELDAAFQAQDLTGADAVRTWVSMGDERVRPDHAAADGQVVGLDEPFTIGGESMMYPGDPAGSDDQTSRCRCWLDWSLRAR